MPFSYRDLWVRGRRNHRKVAQQGMVGGNEVVMNQWKLIIRGCLSWWTLHLQPFARHFTSNHNHHQSTPIATVAPRSRMSTLPTQREILSDIVQQLGAVTPAPDDDASTSLGGIGGGGAILANLDEKHRQLILSLHCLLPTTFLSALDLLNRGLVARYRVSQIEDERVDHNQQAPQSQRPYHVYYVSSISAISNGSKKHTFHPTGLSINSSRYEVKLHAWNCTCAGFVYSAMYPPAEMSDFSFPGGGKDSIEHDEGAEQGLLWGGCTVGEGAASSPPAGTSKM
ncbi:hypothetical protein EX30DRAFT_362040 [Ascodesmis nigricans]|uniref:SWIM-type domain-containing protein n=1 Tax=Ascodesmis nigricans TaxID=341454 RepID=A0A4S2N4Q3_9PEZI|nr:hypothetical protein EX30DRAFT_362040 [Ascodesmis nigricans]